MLGNLNGEEKIGYTLHRVRAGMDDGEIFDIAEVEIGNEETYSSARQRIKKIFCANLEKNFLKILNGENLGKVQPKSGIVYNSRLRREDSVINSWNYSSTYILGLMKIFSDGSGLFMKIREQIYKILKMSAAEEIVSSIGIAGGVVNSYSDGSVLIKTSDTAVKIFELADENGKKILPREVLKIGMRL